MEVLKIVVLSVTIEELVERTDVRFRDSSKHIQQVSRLGGRGRAKREDILHAEFEESFHTRLYVWTRCTYPQVAMKSHRETEKKKY